MSLLATENYFRHSDNILQQICLLYASLKVELVFQEDKQSTAQELRVFKNQTDRESQFYTLFHNSVCRFFYSDDGKSYDPRLIISYQPRRFYEFYCKGFH